MFFIKFIIKLIISNQWHWIMGHKLLKTILHCEISIKKVDIQQSKFQTFKKLIYPFMNHNKNKINN